MEISKSVDILQVLADGVDPATGEVFPCDSPYSSPEVIRALFTCIQHIHKTPTAVKKTLEEKQTDNLRKNLPKNAGMPWSDKLKMELEKEFKGGFTIFELANKFGRTKVAIVSELKRQSLVTDEEAKTL